jgi:hypothetical protein
MLTKAKPHKGTYIVHSKVPLKINFVVRRIYIWHALINHYLKIVPLKHRDLQDKYTTFDDGKEIF